MGLSEFQLKDYDPALEHLQRARQLGIRERTSPRRSSGTTLRSCLPRLGLFERAVRC